MSSTLNRTLCVACNKEKITYSCQGCSKKFCLDDLTKHRINLNQQLGQIQNDHDELRQNLNHLKLNPLGYFLIEQIDQWEKESIDKIKQTAQQCKDQWINYSDAFFKDIDKKLHDLAQRIKETQSENEFNEIDLNNLRQKFEKLQKQLDQPTTVSIEQQSTSFINQLNLVFSTVPASKRENEANFVVSSQIAEHLLSNW